MTPAAVMANHHWSMTMAPMVIPAPVKGSALGLP
jgi:hypothetical protein